MYRLPAHPLEKVNSRNHPNQYSKIITKPKKAKYGVILAIPFQKPGKNRIKYKLDELSKTAKKKD